MRSISIALAVVALAFTGTAYAQNAAPAGNAATGNTPAGDTAAGDATAGANVFKKCSACHQIGPNAANDVGPVLNGVVGRKAGTFPGYSYSNANKTSGLVWDEATLTNYLRSPKKVVPGTKMTFPGLTKDKDIADVIAYLKQFDATGQSAPKP